MLIRVLVGLLLVANLAGATASEAQPRLANRVREITQAQILLTEDQAPPGEMAPWREQSLPDNWNISRPGIGGYAWYRVLLPNVDSTGDWAIYIPRASMNFSVYLNGKLLAIGGKFSEPVARNWNRPQLFALPAGILEGGSDILHVRLRVYADIRGGLSEIRFGPREILQEEFDNEYFLRIVVSQITGLLTIVLSGFILMLWWRRRQDTVYLFFSIGLLLWSLQTTNLFVRDVPLPSTYAWELVVAMTLPLFALTLALFVFRFVEYANPFLERIIGAMALCVPASFLLLGPRHFQKLSAFWYVLSMIGGAGLFLLILRTAWRKRTSALIVLSVTSAGTMAFGVNDYLVHMSLLPFRHGHLLQLGAPLLFLSIAVQLVDRFSGALREVETLNRDLELRIAHKTSELEANYATLSQMERERVITEERARITRDMHDGLGSHLINALNRLQDGASQKREVEALLREALDDLRLIIDATDPSDGDLSGALGNLRYRFEPRLRAAGVTLEWRVGDLVNLGEFQPAQILQVLRIVQEAVANIVKHASATRIVVQSGDSEDGPYLQIADNGIGLGQANPGRGLGNMTRRAVALGGRLMVRDGSPGTIVTLFLPLAAKQ